MHVLLDVKREHYHLATAFEWKESELIQLSKKIVTNIKFFIIF